MEASEITCGGDDNAVFAYCFVVPTRQGSGLCCSDWLLDMVASGALRLPSPPPAGERRLVRMSSDDVEHELLRLHQFHRLRYEAAGSLARLELPFESAAAFARSLV